MTVTAINETRTRVSNFIIFSLKVSLLACVTRPIFDPIEKGRGIQQYTNAKRKWRFLVSYFVASLCSRPFVLCREATRPPTVHFHRRFNAFKCTFLNHRDGLDLNIINERSVYVINIIFNVWSYGNVSIIKSIGLQQTAFQ